MLKCFNSLKFIFLSIFIISIPTDFLKASDDQKKIQTLNELNNSGFYYTIIPWIKDALNQSAESGTKISTQYEEVLSKVIKVTGVKSFETLSITSLSRSNNPHIRFTHAKKLLKRKQYDEALKLLQNINEDSSIYPYVLHLRGTLFALTNKFDESVSEFRKCQKESRRQESSESGLSQKQLKINADYCLLGEARSYFTVKDFKNAELKYLDIDKESFVWPEILFEEAWNSYYLKNYNRALGKLVTYNAPIFDYYFNPEISVLNALSYMRLCMYKDVNKVANQFYQTYLQPTKDLREFLLQHGKNYQFYFELIQEFEKTRKANNPLMDRLLKSILREGAYLEIKKSFLGLLQEKQLLENQSGKVKDILDRNAEGMIKFYSLLMGGYVRKQLLYFYTQLFKAFDGISYIKLEVLSQKKEQLYSDTFKPGKRGDPIYLEKNDKQYRWDFMYEFWADELGDYVFALASECNGSGS